MEFITRLPAVLGLPISVLLTCTIGLDSYYFSRWVLRVPESKGTEAIVVNLFRGTAMLLGLILSLTFADVRSELGILQDGIELEAAELGDIFEDLSLYGTPEAAAIQSKLIDYTRSLIDDEWEALRQDRLSQSTKALFEEIQEGLLDLEPTTLRQESLRARLLEDIDQISDHRQARLQHATMEPAVFVLIALVGFIVSMILLGAYRGGKRSTLLLAIYGAFIGTVLFVILSMRAPFEGALRVSPSVFERVYANFMDPPLKLELSDKENL